MESGVQQRNNSAATPLVINAHENHQVVLITGGNSGVGYGIVERLLTHYLQLNSEKSNDLNLTIVLACRNQSRADAAVRKLEKDFDLKRYQSQIQLDVQLMDLSSTASVFKACDELKEKYPKMDTLFLNAGLIPIKKMDIKTGAWNLLTRPSYVAKTGGDVILQHVGLVNDEGLGDTFAANVFGHWLLVRELTPLLATSEYGGKAVWFTSTTADPDFFDPKDYQCIKGNHPYESSKRLCELLSFYLSTESEKSKINSYVCSPGNCMSNITQNTINSFLLIIVYYFMRFCFCSGMNIKPINGATAPLFIHTEKSPKDLDPFKVYHSDITPWGTTWVKHLEAPQEDIGEVVKDMDKLLEKFKRVYMNNKN